MTADDGDYVIFDTHSLPQKPDDFLVLFSKDERATAPKLPYENYHIEIKRLEGDDQFKIMFSFLDSADKVQDTVTLDALKYFLKRRLAYECLIPKPERGPQFETFYADFGVAYLQKFFGEKIEGNKAFWEQFHEQLDNACQPLQYQMEWYTNNFFVAPIIVRSKPTAPDIPAQAHPAYRL